MRGDVMYVMNLARTSRMRKSHEAVEQGVEADEAEPEWSFAA
jgi:hypothetical protein